MIAMCAVLEHKYTCDSSMRVMEEKRLLGLEATRLRSKLPKSSNVEVVEPVYLLHLVE